MDVRCSPFFNSYFLLAMLTLYEISSIGRFLFTRYKLSGSTFKHPFIVHSVTEYYYSHTVKHDKLISVLLKLLDSNILSVGLFITIYRADYSIIFTSCMNVMHERRFIYRLARKSDSKSTIRVNVATSSVIYSNG